MPVVHVDQTVPSSTRLWRYMDMAGLLSMLENSALWFPKCGFLEDPHEGLIPAAFVTSGSEDEDARITIRGKDVGNAAELMLYSCSTILVNCWHESDCESAAMWAIYGTARGIALSTTVDRLSAALNTNQRELRVDRVRYLDYVNPDDRLLALPWLMKRNAFAYEREVRVWTASDGNGQPPQGTGDLVTVHVSTLVESLYLSPRAEPWLGTLISNLLRRYSVGASVQRSTLYDKPDMPLPNKYIMHKVR